MRVGKVQRGFFLIEKGIAVSHTTAYNPAGNGQVEKYNGTPHERLFRFARRSMSGKAVPTWLTTPGPVFLKRHVHTSKTEPLVNEVELLIGNSNYAYICYPDGWETTVSTKHLAPCGERIENLLSQVSSQPAESLQTVFLHLLQSHSDLDTQPDIDVATKLNFINLL